MRKKLILIGGGFLLIIAIILIIVSLWGFVMINSDKGDDGYLTSDIYSFSTESYAISSYNIDIELVDSFIPSYLSWLTFDDGVIVKLTASTDSSKNLFIGLGNSNDVSNYLSNIEYIMASNYTYWINPFEVDLELADYVYFNGNSPNQKPENETFWLLSDSGSNTVTINTPVKDGSYRLVFMNADGSPNLNVNFQISAKFPFADRTVIVFLAIGIILSIISSCIIYFIKFKTK